MEHLLGLSELAGAALVAGVWQGLALAAIVGLCLRFAPEISATTRFAIWAGALVLLCILPIAESGTWRHVSYPVDASLVHLDARWSVAAVGIWIMLSLARAAQLARQALFIRQLASQASPITLPAGLRSLLKSGRAVELCTSTQLDRPGVIGFFHPRILVPAWLYEQLTANEIEQIVLHEKEHLQRRDDWLNLLQKLSLVFFPLNPVLLWIDRRLCLERELACDEGVIHKTNAPRSYASCLARLAEQGLDRRGPSLALGAMERQSLLARRVYRILGTPAIVSPWQGRMLTVAVGAALLTGAVALARCPQLVSFRSRQGTMTASAAAPFSPRDLALRTRVPQQFFRRPLPQG